MNTTTHYVLPLYTVRNRRGDAVDWINGTAFVSASQSSADDCATAHRRYDADKAFTGNITGEWGVVEHKEPFRVSIHGRRVHAIRELNDRKAQGIKCEIRVTAALIELWAIPQVKAIGSSI